jgi:hypothetical protein
MGQRLTRIVTLKLAGDILIHVIVLGNQPGYKLLKRGGIDRHR